MRGPWRLGAIALLAAAFLATAPLAAGRSIPAEAPFEVSEASIAELQQALGEGRVTSRGLVQAYLDRIAAYDRRGPALNAIISINPNALQQAAALDRERAEKGPRGPLHGVPILVKDNFSTADMPTSAGTLALATYRTQSDAYQVRRLREAGAIILGKTTMHELAMNILNVSSLTGETRNPYDPRRSPGGSSGGTGAGIGASFAAAGMGTDTCGSIRVPAAWQDLFGLRATRGLSSRAGVIPLSSTEDVAGPLARSVTDLAIMLDATVGYDPDDPVTAVMKGRPAPRYRDHLAPGALKSVRIGVLREYLTPRQMNGAVRDRTLEALEQMRARGATLVDVEVPGLDPVMTAAGNVIVHEFRFDFGDFLRLHPGAPIGSISDLVTGGLVHETIDARLKRRNASETRDEKAYAEVMAKRAEGRRMILDAMDRAGVDVLVYPTITQPPVIWGAELSGVATCGLSANTGLPALALPLGLGADLLPVGLDVLGRPFDEMRLLNFAYDWEALAKPRVAPFSTPPLDHGASPGVARFDLRVGDRAKSRASARIAFAYDPLKALLTYDARLERLGDDAPVALTLQRAEGGRAGPVVAVLLRPGELTGRSELHFTPRMHADLIAGRLMIGLYTQKWPLGLARVPIAPPATVRQERARGS